MDVNRIVGLRLRAARGRARLSQEALAARLGLSRPTVVNMEHGRHHMGVDVLIRAARALRVPACELLPEAHGAPRFARKLAKLVIADCEDPKRLVVMEFIALARHLAGAVLCERE